MTGTAVGIDVGGTKCLGVVIDQAGEVLEEVRVPTPRTGPALIDALAQTASQLLGTDAGGRSSGPIGVGLPGLVDTRGVLRFAPNLPRVVELAVADDLSDRLDGRPVVAGNDVNCACWGERTFGAARDHDDVLLVTLGTGIGGGVVTGGRLLLGANGFAGEVGHMVVDPHGPPCPCGRRGCWERFASGSGLGRLAQDAARAGRSDRMVELAGGDADDVRGEHASRAAAEGDPGALAVVDELAWWLAVGLASLANVFDPDRIVVGGGLIGSGDLFLEPASAYFWEMVEGAHHRPEIDIVLAALGEHAGAVGAAALATANPSGAAGDRQ